MSDQESKPLQASRCVETGTVYFPPRAFSVDTPGNNPTEPVELGGAGTLYSITNVHVGPNAPCAIGYVDLDEGVRAMARFDAVDDPSALIGQDRQVQIGYGPIGTDLEDVVLGRFVDA